MLIYEYKCGTCGRRFERAGSYNNARLPSCPDGHTNTQRIFSTPAIIFKGNGFYSTDNHSGSGSSRNNGDE